MKIKDIQMTVETVNSGLHQALLGAKVPYWDYQDNKRTTEEPAGFKYSVALIGNQLATLELKVPGKDTTPHITEEFIAARNAAMNFITAEFIDSVVKIYNIKGEQIVVASASTVKLVDDEMLDFGKGVK